MTGACLLLALLAADPAPPAPAPDDRRKRMESAQSEEVNILLKLSQLDRLLYQRDEELRLLDKTTEKVGADVAEKEAEVDRLRRNVEENRSALAARIKSLFEFSRNGMIQTIFSSGSFDDLYRRMKFTTMILDQDRRNFLRYSASLQAVERESEELKKGQRALQAVEEEITQKRRTVEDQRRDKETVLASVRETKDLYRKALKEMDEAGAEVAGVVGDVKAPAGAPPAPGAGPEAAPAPPFSGLKGTLPLPTQGRIVGFFGKFVEPRFHSAVVSKGVVIEAREGADVKAVAAGTVIYTGWFRGYGVIVILDHGEGYFSLYGHLSRVLVDMKQRVTEGQVVALVGDTGSLEGSQLYLEIRYHGTPVNPLEWIRITGGPQ